MTAGPAAAAAEGPSTRTELVRRGERVAGSPLVSIVILVMDSIDRLTACLRSLNALVATPSHEIVIVGNGTAASALASLPDPASLVVVPSPVNLGFAGGCNWGARFARGRHLVFLNDDTEVEPDWLAALVDVAHTDRQIGAVGSRLLAADGTLQEAGSILWRDAGTHQVGRGLPAGSHEYDRVRDTDYCSGCGLLVTREAWEAVGGFDERYFPAYHEDVDLCLSLRAHGFRTVHAPAARVVHHGGASLPDDVRALIGIRNGRRFLAKWGDALEEYNPQPVGQERERAVAAAILRAEHRQLPTLPVGEPVTQSLPPSELEALRVQVRALQAAVTLREELLQQLRGDHAKMERLRRVADRVPGGRRAAGWVARRLGAR